ncbi:MAG: ATP phosphoribosyltransferase regulatory subunit, partial [Clostridia bacterium]|nr:ATP phosphoribosyltransferase regulatory subunit [Clostridia bacterium]
MQKTEETLAIALRELYRGYGYQPYKMSRFEEYDLYVRNKDFLLSDSIITFTDADGRLMALKPDVTLSIVKNCPEEKDGLRKVYYNETVYRPSKEDRSFREIMQIGLECIGSFDTYGIS